MYDELDGIDPKVANVIREYGTQPAIRIGDLVRYIGVEALAGEMECKISGQISNQTRQTIYGKETIYGKDWIIRLNKNEARFRQRFTVAYLFSHFLLHKSEIQDSTITCNVLYKTRLGDDADAAALRLADRILMPRSQVAECAGRMNMEQITLTFRVSRPTMERRLLELGLVARAGFGDTNAAASDRWIDD